MWFASGSAESRGLFDASAELPVVNPRPGDPQLGWTGSASTSVEADCNCLATGPPPSSRGRLNPAMKFFDLAHSNPASHDQQIESSNNTMGPISGVNNHNNLTLRQRLRWTNELHDRFVDAVTQLGGPDRATPKGVLRIMGVQGLTIYHVKSHLQKYRLAKYVPEVSADGVKSEKNGDRNSIAGIENSSGIQITEALKLQMEVQKRLQEQLEVQRQLQLRIEAQGKYLKKIIDEQQRLSGVLAEFPGSDNSAPNSGGHCLDSGKADHSTPAPISESPRQDKATGREHGDTDGLYKSISCDGSFSSRQEPLTPDSSFHASAPSARNKSEIMVAHILESSSSSDFHH
ncbi:hypothetical protein ZIOFF_071869 [Zingiber officinale]|uniref:HTH myb-type domain-containing protein n=1 Tax=Zingiber officinale TaxID=94328 RepID=A0A8J5EUM0_ZINOF|nr:hypothetical protein ZIOFF_071869 [Zingiber officinale]